MTDEWQTWNLNATTTSASTVTTWVTWTSTTTVGVTPSLFVTNSPQVDVEAQRQRARERLAASKRAEETLLSLLTEDQVADWRRMQAFELLTQSGRRYRVRRGRSGNVRLVEDGREVEMLCCHPGPMLPVEDTVVAQVLALRTDEEGFRRTANITRTGWGMAA